MDKKLEHVKVIETLLDVVSRLKLDETVTVIGKCGETVYNGRVGDIPFYWLSTKVERCHFRSTTFLIKE